MSKDEYLITDPPLKALTVFAMPMILGSFFSTSIQYGRFHNSWSICWLLGTCGCWCLCCTDQCFYLCGAWCWCGRRCACKPLFWCKNYGKMKTIVSTSLISFLILSVVLGVFGFCFSHFMMSGLQTPADILEEAVLYLRVYFVGFPFLFMYNILSTMFTSIGESKIPLGLLIFSSILNILWISGWWLVLVWGCLVQPLRP